MSNTDITPAGIDEALAAAEAEAIRLRAKQAAVVAAETDARYATSLSIYRAAAGEISIERNRVRSTALEHMEALAAAGELDLTKLFEAFMAVQTADAHCGATGIYAANLNTVDPLPDNGGVPRAREPRAKQMYRDLTWSAYLDDVVKRRTESERLSLTNQLNYEAACKIDEAAKAAGEKAARLADGKQLDVARPPSIADQHTAAVAAIKPSSFDEDRVRGSSLHAVMKKAASDSLTELIDAGN